MRDICIRTARAADAAQMIALLNPIIRAGNLTSMRDELSIEEQVEFIRNFPDAGVFNVAHHRDSGCVLGVQDVIPVVQTLDSATRVGSISSFVAMQAQRRGIGAALTRATVCKARILGFTAIQAHIRIDNTSALSFYESQGFQRVVSQLSAPTVNNHPTSTVVLECALGE